VALKAHGAKVGERGGGYATGMISPSSRVRHIIEGHQERVGMFTGEGAREERTQKGKMNGLKKLAHVLRSKKKSGAGKKEVKRLRASKLLEPSANG